MKWKAILVVVFSAAAVNADPPDKRIPFWDRPDPLGRKIPWGDEVDGQRACLNFPRTRLLYGQPLELQLVTTRREDKPPYLRVHMDGPNANVKIEWTTDTGEAIPFRVHGIGWSQSIVSSDRFRVIPTGKFSKNGCVIPGSYRLTIVIDAVRDPSDGIEWVGRLKTNVLEITVVESTPEGRKKLLSNRARAEELIKTLDDSEFKKRSAAEAELMEMGVDVLPLLWTTGASATPNTRAAFHRISRKLTEFKRPPDPSFAGLTFGSFTDAVWAALADNFPESELERLRVEAAMYGPVPYEPGDGPPDPATVKRLLADLRDPRPWVRIAAARAVPDNAGEELLAALVKLLDDPYSVLPRQWAGEPPRERIIATNTRRHVLPRFGKSIIGPLLDFARKHPKPALIDHLVIPLLGDLGFDPRGLEYLNHAVSYGHDDSRWLAIRALGDYGPNGTDILLQVAKTPVATGQANIQRREAIETLPKTGDAKTVGPVLRELLKEKNWEFISAAAQGLDRLNVREAVPDLMRVTRDEATEQNARSAAIAAVSRLADRADAEAMLMELTRSKSVSARGQSAHWLAALECRAAIPRLLELLTDEDWYVRAMTDHALRSLAQKPEGVGYDDHKPNPEKWREYWKNRK
jgi:HEAT repeat protein